MGEPLPSSMRPPAPPQIVHLRPMEKDGLPPRLPGYTRFVLLSDTHTHTFNVPKGDILLHAGDLTEGGSNEELRTTINWLTRLPHKHKVIIAGNHDYCLDEQTLLGLQSTYYKHKHKKGKAQDPAIESVNSDIYDEAIALVTSPEVKAAGLVYLKDELYEVPIPDDSPAEEGSATVSDGEGPRRTKWRIWGSPWSAAFCSMAFNVPRGGPSAGESLSWAYLRLSDFERQLDLYSGIPDDTDILISHGPPFGILDRIARNRQSVGCEMLLQRTQAIKPRMQVWGHIHEDRGVQIDDSDAGKPGTVYVNAANAGTFARPRRWGTHEYQPIVVDLKNDL